jgi:trehalose-6-phosphate synthase
VNPYAVDETSESIRQALEMAPAEREARMARMRGIVQSHNVFRWAGKLLKEAVAAGAPALLGQGVQGAHGEIAREI